MAVRRGDSRKGFHKVAKTNDAVTGRVAMFFFLEGDSE